MTTSQNSRTDRQPLSYRLERRAATNEEAATARAYVAHISAGWGENTSAHRRRQDAYRDALDALVFASDAGDGSVPDGAGGS